MPTVSFKEGVTPDQVTDPAETQPGNQLAKVQDKTLAAPPSDGFQVEGLSGEWTGRDLKPPRLNLVQKVGPLSDQFDLGEWVIEKAAVVGGGGNPETNNNFKDPLSVVVVNARKQYQESKKFGEEDFPMVLDTEAEVFNVGGTFKADPEDWKLGIDGKILFKPVVHVVLWLTKPAVCPPEAEAFFTMTDPDGNEGALVVYSAANTSYKGIGPAIATAGSTYAKSNLSGFKWKLGARKCTNDGNSYAAAQLRPDGKCTPELAAFLKEFAH